MAKVMCFGTFDGIHEGHRRFLAQASGHGDLRIVVARDATVRKVKGRSPLADESTRLQALREEGFDAVLGSLGDKYAVLEDYRPDIVCLGYDQEAFTDRLTEALAERGLTASVIRLEAFEPDTYKSSKINAHPHRNGESRQGG